MTGRRAELPSTTEISVKPRRVLVTGSSGLVGSALVRALQQRGTLVGTFDLREHGDALGDVRDRERVASAVASVDGVIHLAAISRVIWGERDPDGCWETNVGGTSNVLEAARRAPHAPWVIFASSREVYGEPERLPVTEECPFRPVNIYGRSKVEGERLVEGARETGMRACTIRLSNVFGSVSDHADRVVPAFVRAAISGDELRVDGAEHTFDFTHVDDVARGIVTLAELLTSNEPAPPPIHLVTGQPTTLGQLAALAIRLAGTSTTMRESPARDFDVARFVGDAERARRVLGWQPRVSLPDGLARLIHEFREARALEAVAS